MLASDDSKEMLKELMRDKTPEYLDDYIKQMTNRVNSMKDWIRWLKLLRAEKLREQRGIKKGGDLGKA